MLPGKIRNAQRSASPVKRQSLSRITEPFSLSLCSYVLNCLELATSTNAMLRIYQVPSVQRLMRNMLSEHGPRTLKIIGGPLRGQQLSIVLPTEVPIWLGIYELWLQRAFEELLAPGAVAWDVGAHIGYTIIMMAKSCADIDLVAIEPCADTVMRLEENLQLAGIADSAQIIQCAVWSSQGKQVLWHSLRGPACNSIISPSPEHMGAGETVSTVSLDDVLTVAPKPDLVKIDVEGAEAPVLDGSRKILDEVRPVLVLEVDRQTRDPVMAKLRLSRYECYRRVTGTDYRDRRREPSPIHLIALPEEKKNLAQRVPMLGKAQGLLP